MGKGNVKSFKGKLFKHSFGKYRLRKRKKKAGELPKPVEIKKTATPRFAFLPKDDMQNKPAKAKRLADTLQKGDIVRGRQTRHPIVYLGELNEFEFKGCFITHSAGYKINKGLKESYFCKKDERGNEYEIQYEKTYVCRCLLVKKNEWGPYTKVGQLTDEGVQFIENAINGQGAIVWNDRYRGQ